jgi:CRISPR-associated endoribonuclease Cas6
MTQTNTINDSLTLYSTVLKLTPTADGLLTTSPGRLVQGAFLDLIRSIDPGLSAALHAENRRRPYTLSTLLDTDRHRKGQIKLRAGQQLRLRFTLLGSDLFTTFSRFLLSPPSSQREGWGRGPTLRLGDLTFAITEVLTTPGSDNWAGYTRLDDLCQQWQTGRLDESAHKIRLHFASGVMFSRSSNKAGLGKFLEFYPSPEMFFGSVEARWRELTELPSPLKNKDLRDYAQETIVVSAFDMKTVRRDYWGNPQLGGVGHITYELRDKDNPEMIRFLNLLADFAFYSGVGAKTTIGMGQVCRIID